MDIGVLFDGYYGDVCMIYIVGQVSDEVWVLVDIICVCLQVGFDEVCFGVKIGDIGYVIQSFVELCGYGVVCEYIGYGIGKCLYEDFIIYYWGVYYIGLKLQFGMVFIIELMINFGMFEMCLFVDGWMVIMVDKKFSVQFEYMLVVMLKGYDILML